MKILSNVRQAGSAPSRASVPTAEAEVVRIRVYLGPRASVD